ncbi:glycosyltransferase [uncultured Brevundimonas sp.]|uniref:glycosyltransferase n=1 Tax=uncultured Brevundimonas sp. TaxID=213418 RepID=UPI002626FDCA|nr:glycosyltransferase [uncultured Brevundimonas sp.]
MFIIDAVPLQGRKGLSDTYGVLEGIVRALAGADDVRFLLTRYAAVPEFMSEMDGQFIFALPNIRQPQTLIALQDRIEDFESSLRPQQVGCVRMAAIKQSQEFGVAVLECDGSSINIEPEFFEETRLSDFDRLIVEELDGDLSKYLLLDGAVASDKDVLRRLVVLGRQAGKKLLAPWGCDTAVDGDLTKIAYHRSLISYLADKVHAFVFNDDVAATQFSAAHVSKLNGRALKISRLSKARSIDDLEVCVPIRAEGCSAVRGFLDRLPPQHAVKLPEKLRIALVTPMFPDKGGPPHSSLDLALELTKICDLDVWTDSPVLPEHERQFRRVFRLDNELSPSDYDEIVYVLGNHRMYHPIYSMMRQYPGVVIQHDAHMLDFLNGLVGGEGLSELIKHEAGVDYKVTSIVKLISDLENIGVPLLSSVLEPASSVIVHSPGSRDVIARNYDVEVTYLPVGMPYPFAHEQLEDVARRNAKLTLGVDVDRPCIVSFGEVHLLKGAKQCLLTLAELKAMGAPFRFYFVGPVLPELRADLERMRDALGLGEMVTFTDGVSEEEYIRFLQASDIVLQIRQIPFGQLSGALLDAVSAGMYGVSSEGLARAIEAPETIIRVNDKASNIVYAEALYKLIASEKYKVRPAPSWEKFSKDHAFFLYAKNLLERIFGRVTG